MSRHKRPRERQPQEAARKRRAPGVAADPEDPDDDDDFSLGSETDVEPDEVCTEAHCLLACCSCIHVAVSQILHAGPAPFQSSDAQSQAMCTPAAGCNSGTAWSNSLCMWCRSCWSRSRPCRHSHGTALRARGTTSARQAPACAWLRLPVTQHHRVSLDLTLCGSVPAQGCASAMVTSCPAHEARWWL